MTGLDTGAGRPTQGASGAPGGDAQQPPPEQSPAAPARSSLLSRGQALLVGISTTLAALVGIVTHWNDLTSLVFPAKSATAATIVSRVEPDVNLKEFELQAQAPVPRAPSVAALVPGGSSGRRAGYRLAAYVVPASGPPAAGALTAVASEEATKSTETTTVSSAEQEKTIKQESSTVTEEAKHAEEEVAQGKAKATEERKSAEALEQEEQKKAQEAHKRAEETSPQAAAVPKAEEAAARQRVQAAKATVRAKKRDEARPPSERRIEAGTPARVEEVLREAHLPERCRPSCGLKPIIEKTLKASSNDGAAAAVDARVLSQSAGVRVHYELTLKGLEHKVVELTYVLVQTNGPTPPAIYAMPVTIRTVVPRREREVVRGVCWVPVPSSSTQYYHDLTVLDGEAEVESKDTSDFS